LIGIITSRLNKNDVFAAFLSDILEETGIKRISLSLTELKELLSAMQEQDLDFDDAYQYVAAKNNDLTCEL
jgi:predicted nucleic acid-binding protein